MFSHGSVFRSGCHVIFCHLLCTLQWRLNERDGVSNHRCPFAGFTLNYCTWILLNGYTFWLHHILNIYVGFLSISFSIIHQFLSDGPRCWFCMISFKITALNHCHISTYKRHRNYVSHSAELLYSPLTTFPIFSPVIDNNNSGHEPKLIK